MKRYIYTLCMVLLTVLSLTSCLKSNDEEVTLYDDVAITTFTLTAVNRNIHTTTTAGKDSVYKTSLATLPAFSINQYTYEIYNTDSLPTDCDLTHVLVSISTKNNGIVVLKSMDSDSLSYYSSTDSIDFSQPREMRVYANDGSGFRPYQVTLNMRSSDAGRLLWTEMTSEATPATLSQSVMLEEEGAEPTLFRLSTDGGTNWSPESIGADEDKSLLPTSGLAWLSFPLSDDVHYELLIGSCDDGTDKSTIWRKITDRRTTDILRATGVWVNLPLEQTNSYYLPKQTSPSLVWYEGSILAISSEGKIYESRDQGITWKASAKITFPADFGEGQVKAATDDEGNLWLQNTGSGRAWKSHRTK